MSTIRFARLALAVLLILVFAWTIPHYYWKAFDVSIRGPRVSYSPVTDQFLLLKPENKSVRYMDLTGKDYTREEYERLLPLANYRQLAATGQMPDSLRGVKLDLKEIALNNLFVRIMPADIGMPQIPLFPMIESKSGRVKLEMPEAFFRITNRMEFIDAATNAVNEEQTRLFTDTLAGRGFRFPAKQIAGNPTTRKAFDEGYFVVDAADNVFHIKMVRGKPFCRLTSIPAAPRIIQMFIAETSLREYYGFVIAEDNTVSLISYDNYRLIRLPLERYDHRSCALFFGGDLFFRTITVQGEGWLETIVTDRSYAVKAQYSESWPTREEATAGHIASALFPFALHLEDGDAPFVNLHGVLGSLHALWVILVSVIALLISIRVRRRQVRDHVADIVLVAVSGIFGLLAVHMIPPPEE
jgi:hypothetical protein